MTHCNDGDPVLRRELRERLLSLNYNAFTWVVIHLLERLGYADVRPSGRIGFFGRNSRGGYDLEAKLPFALGERRVIIQVKQYGEQMVFRRAVDELRGACLRTGASEGLILSTGPIAPSLSQKGSVNGIASAALGIAPVHLVDGDELLDLLLLHGIGTFTDTSEDGQTTLRIDETYFEGLERFHAGLGHGSGNARTGRTPRFLLTVGVKRLGPNDSTGRITRVIV